MKRKLSSQQSFMLISGIIATGLWLFARPVVLPFVFLNTHIHEMFHAMAAVATGGSVVGVKVFSTGGGVTLTLGGWDWLIASAGYVGTSLVGGAMIWSSKTERGARFALSAIALMLAAELALWLRSDGTGIATNVAFLAGIFIAIKLSKRVALRLVASFTGVILTIAAFESLSALWNISLHSDQHSDAAILQRITGVPDWVWAAGWALLSAFLLVTAVRHAWTEEKIEKNW